MASTGVKKELLRAQVQGSWLNRLENDLLANTDLAMAA